VIIILILLVAAVALIAVLGVVSNTGSGHAVDGDFSIASLDLSNLSTGQLFLYGVVIGVAGTLALTVLLGVVSRRTALHQSQRRLESSQHATDALRVDNERLNQQLDDERAENSEATPIARTRPAVDTGDGRTEIVESVEQDSELSDEPATDEVPDEPAVPERPRRRALIGHREERRP
jgi:hypothetical protein